MADKEQKPCELCGKPDATNFVCCANTGVSQHLCDDCYTRTASPEQLASSQSILDEIKRGKCDYCGEQAAGGAGGFIPILGKSLNLWCEQCRLDLVEFFNRPENEVPRDFPFGDERAIAELSRRSAERELRQQEFMREKINERKSRI